MASLVISYPIPSALQWWSNLGKGVEAYSSIMGYLVPGGRGRWTLIFKNYAMHFFKYVCRRNGEYNFMIY